MSVTDRRWFNHQAVEWVLHESEVDRGQLAVYLVVASFTDTDGRGAWPAQQHVADLTRQSRRQVVRDLATLTDEKHLLPGDRRLVANIRADKRPNVYDLPDQYRLWITDRRGDKLSRRSARGDKLTPRTTERRDKSAPSDVTNATERRDKLSHKEVPEELPENARGGAQPPAAPPTHAQPHPLPALAAKGWLMPQPGDSDGDWLSVVTNRELDTLSEDRLDELARQRWADPEWLARHLCDQCGEHLGTCTCRASGQGEHDPGSDMYRLPTSASDRRRLGGSETLPRSAGKCRVCGNQVDSRYHRTVCGEEP